MYRTSVQRAVLLGAGFVGAWLFVRYLLPIAMPFLAGLLLALAAEPAVRLGTRLKLPRWAATAADCTGNHKKSTKSLGKCCPTRSGRGETFGAAFC